MIILCYNRMLPCILILMTCDIADSQGLFNHGSLFELTVKKNCEVSNHIQVCIIMELSLTNIIVYHIAGKFGGSRRLLPN